MSIAIVEGFKVYNGISKICVCVESERIDACMEFFYSGNYDGIWINPSHGYHMDDIDFLKDHPRLKHVEIIKKLKSINGLYALKGLNNLLISNNDLPLDFARFRKLRCLRAEWSPKYQNIGRCQALILLDLSKFKPKSNDLQSFSDLKNLEELSLVQGNIRSLSGIGRLPKLKKIELSYLRNLAQLDEIEKLDGHLRELRLEKCKKITNHEYAARVKSLKRLAFNDCGEIPSLAFLNELPDLEDFRFVNTNVRDGDLRPLLRLKSAGFFDKKHYSHKYDEVQRLLARNRL